MDLHVLFVHFSPQSSIKLGKVSQTLDIKECANEMMIVLNALRKTE